MIPITANETRYAATFGQSPVSACHRPWASTAGSPGSGTGRSSVSSVIAIASTPSLKASSRPLVMNTMPAPNPSDPKAIPRSAVRAPGEQVVGRPQPVEDQQPVEVVELVLRRPRFESLHPEHPPRAVHVRALEHDLPPAVDVGGEVGDRQAALAHDLPAVVLDHL